MLFSFVLHTVCLSTLTVTTQQVSALLIIQKAACLKSKAAHIKHERYIFTPPLEL